MREWSMVVALGALVAMMTPAHADSIAATCEAAPNVEPIDSGDGCVGFVARDEQGRVVSRIAKGTFEVSGVILASPDGRSVVLIHSYPQSEKHDKDKDGILVFRDGKRVARYSIKELLVREKMFYASISHFYWLRRKVWMTEDGFDLVLGPTLPITTTSFRSYEIDTVTGKLLKADDHDDWKQCSVIAEVRGVFDVISNLYFSIDPSTTKGTLSKGMWPFTIGPTVKHADFVARSTVMVCAVESKPGTWQVIRAIAD